MDDTDARVLAIQIIDLAERQAAELAGLAGSDTV